jgi:hypothetical protein
MLKNLLPIILVSQVFALPVSLFLIVLSAIRGVHAPITLYLVIQFLSFVTVNTIKED